MLGLSSVLSLALLALPLDVPLDALPPGFDPSTVESVEQACGMYVPGIVDEALYVQACGGLPSLATAAPPAGVPRGPPAAPPAPPPPPVLDAWRAEGVLDLAFGSFGTLRLDGALRIDGATAGGSALSPGLLRALLAAQPPEARAAAVEEPVHLRLEQSLAAGGARVEELDVHADPDSLDAAQPDGAPLRVAVRGSLLPQSAPPGEEAERKARAALAAGARLTMDLRLDAPPGADLTYRIRPPPGLAFADADPEGRVTLRLDNRDGAEGLARDVRLVLVDPAAPAPPPRQDVRARVDVTLGAPAEGGVPFRLDLTLDAHALDVPPGMLPPGLALQVISADGLRALRAGGALSEDDLARAEAGMLDALRADLAPLLPDATLAGGLARGTLAPSAAGAPLRLDARVEGLRPLPAKEASDAALALALGASLRLDVPLPATGLAETTYVLHPPPGHVLVGAPESGLPVTAGPEGGRAEVVLRRADRPVLDASDARLLIEVDIRGVDTSGMLEGRGADLVLDVRARGTLRAVEIPPELRATLDPRVDLTHVDADGLRLLRRHGLLDEANVTMLETRLLTDAQSSLRDAFGADAAVRGGFDLATLDGNASGAPVLFEAHATLRQPVLGGAEAPPTAALGLYSERRSFTLPRMQGFETHYLVLLPEGFQLSGVLAEGGGATLQTIGGREAMLLRPESDSMTAHATLTVTSGYVMAHHAGALAALLAGVLLVAQAPVAGLLLWRARRARKAVSAEAQAEALTPPDGGP